VAYAAVTMVRSAYLGNVFPTAVAAVELYATGQGLVGKQES
jgi:hypothetical protein